MIARRVQAMAVSFLRQLLSPNAILVLLSVGLYLGSFFLPALVLKVLDDEQSFSGWEAFWFIPETLSKFYSQSHWGLDELRTLKLIIYGHLIGWMANPALWVGVCLFSTGRRRAAAAAGALGICMVALWFLPASIRFRLLLLEFAPDVLFWFVSHFNYGSGLVGSFQAGFYLWFASIGLLTAAGFVRVLRSTPIRLSPVGPTQHEDIRADVDKACPITSPSA